MQGPTRRLLPRRLALAAAGEMLLRRHQRCRRPHPCWPGLRAGLLRRLWLPPHGCVAREEGGPAGLRGRAQLCMVAGASGCALAAGRWAPAAAVAAALGGQAVAGSGVAGTPGTSSASRDQSGLLCAYSLRVLLAIAPLGSQREQNVWRPGQALFSIQQQHPSVARRAPHRGALRQEH